MTVPDRRDGNTTKLGGIPVVDRPLGAGFCWLLGAGLAAALVFWLWYGIATPPGSVERYFAERAAALDDGAMVSEEMLRELAGDRFAVQSGEEAYERSCESCHGPAGEGGDVGPNLRSTEWITESSPVEIYTTIVEGRNEDGMPPWGSLGPATCMNITAYLLTIREERDEGEASR